MAGEIPNEVFTAIAAADLSNDRFKAVKYDAAGKIVLAGEQDIVAGILQEDPILDQAARVMKRGESFAVAGAAVTPGQLLECDASGRLVPLGTGNGNAAVVAVSRDTAALNEVFTVQLIESARTEELYADGLVSSADLSTSVGLGAVLDGAGKVAVAGAAAKIIGVIEKGPAAADLATKVKSFGATTGTSGAAFTAGDELEVDAAGKFITLAAGVSVGFALADAGGADVSVPIFLK